MADKDPQKREQLAFELNGDLKPINDELPEESSSGKDLRNNLNDLTNKEWMISTKSVWRTEAESQTLEETLAGENIQLFFQWMIENVGIEKAEEILKQVLPSVMESRPSARDSLKSQHPATFAESDIEKLILYFTKKGDTVLDPFVGSGSTLVACKAVQRRGIGIELVSQWADSARQRVNANSLPLLKNVELEDEYEQRVIEGDARRELSKIGDETIDFVVTSPPYWKILHKDTDHKVKRERKTKGLETRYSELEDDLGNIGSYEVFFNELKRVFIECHRVLKNKRYMCVIVSDFRDRGRFIPYHSDISHLVEECGFTLQGITILVQDSKNLYPYGIPYAFVSNIHHQYILIFRRVETNPKE